ncbi:hypothetical protein [Dyadobacter fermentans]|uniref:Uncharacterized protein n=1 Tax=Dyadobacter fermentans (strain ATCC 700827 / DSM 18053 / CIP 107007 / KCTC 52180 / NS114) TaxID=471854 RepID=C6VT67_DYAFD|nr:hypothetical protein [Dyadobacter fermentans]ACT96431.1 hypothetical protein Dfer_5233 [Dyadobacter fermentans DSM 18053]
MMKKLVILLISILYSPISYCQESIEANFENKFAFVANKSVAWNSLIDYLRPSNTLTYYKLTTDTVWHDPCQVIAVTPPRACPQIDYLKYFKKAVGHEMVEAAAGYQVKQTYTFLTNSRPGEDLKTNIDTIRNMSFEWSLENSTIAKRSLRKETLRLYRNIYSIISKFYRTEKDYNGKAYWAYSKSRSAIGRMEYFYDKPKKRYVIIFASNIEKVD